MKIEMLEIIRPRESLQRHQKREAAPRKVNGGRQRQADIICANTQFSQSYNTRRLFAIDSLRILAY
jgi:hypothetical protein